MVRMIGFVHGGRPAWILRGRSSVDPATIEGGGMLPPERSTLWGARNQVFFVDSLAYSMLRCKPNVERNNT